MVVTPKNLYSHLPLTPGVYLMKDAAGKVLYVGKAGNLRRRVSSYFTRPHDARIERLVRGIRRISYKKTDTAIEALILEAELIKKLEPSWNVREKDDKSFLYVGITKEKFPRVLLLRGRDKAVGERFGPFTSSSSVREALRILRRIFPWSVHEPGTLGSFKRPCLDYQIGLCPGTCIGAADPAEYARAIGNIRLIFRGKRRQLLRDLRRDMARASGALEFEKAEKIRRQIFALEHVQDVALVSESEMGNGWRGAGRPPRIEGYDISDISGTSATGSMVVFVNGRPEKSEYRKFRIKSVAGPNDIAMLKEVLRRRFKRRGWPLPNLMLIDGGKGQVGAAREVLRERRLRIPVLGIVKGPTRKRNDIIGKIPPGVEKNTLIRVRDEAHRFAIRYHRRLRSIALTGRP